MLINISQTTKRTSLVPTWNYKGCQFSQKLSFWLFEAENTINDQLLKKMQTNN